MFFRKKFEHIDRQLRYLQISLEESSAPFQDITDKLSKQLDQLTKTIYSISARLSRLEAKSKKKTRGK